MSFESLLIHRVYLGSYTSSQNYLGEWKHNYSYSTDSTKCRLSPVTATQKTSNPGILDDVKYKAIFPSGTSISTGGRVKYNSNEYIVKECYYDSSHHHISCLLSEL